MSRRGSAQKGPAELSPPRARNAQEADPKDINKVLGSLLLGPDDLWAVGRPVAAMIYLTYDGLIVVNFSYLPEIAETAPERTKLGATGLIYNVVSGLITLLVGLLRVHFWKPFVSLGACIFEPERSC